MDMKKVGPAPLDPKVTKRLLDLLSTDDVFRALFKRDAQAALEQVGFVAPKAEAGQPPVALPGFCFQLKPGQELASKDKIIRERAKLEHALSLVQNFDRLPGTIAD